MKVQVSLVLFVLIIIISGCIQNAPVKETQTPQLEEAPLLVNELSLEEKNKKALILADSSIHGSNAIRSFNLFQNSKNCTQIEFISFIEKQINDSQDKNKLIEDYNKSMNCVVEFKKEVVNAVNEIFEVNYSFEFSENCEKFEGLLSSSTIEINLENDSTKLKGATPTDNMGAFQPYFGAGMISLLEQEKCALLLNSSLSIQPWQILPENFESLSMEEKAIQLSETQPEAQEAIIFSKTIEETKKCAENEFVLLAQKTEKLSGEKTTLIKKLEETKKCLPTLKKELEKTGEKTFTIKYLSAMPEECSVTQFQNLIRNSTMEINLENNSVKVLGVDMENNERGLFALIATGYLEMAKRNNCATIAVYSLNIPLEELELK